jgi:ribonuclease D
MTNFQQSKLRAGRFFRRKVREVTDVFVKDMAVEVHYRDLPEDFYEHALDADSIAWDIETSGLNWAVDRIGTCQLATRDRICVVVLDQRVPPTLLMALLQNSSVRKVFHHAPFDLRFMAYQWGISPCNVACTKISSKILDPDLSGREHSLLPVLRRHLGIEISKVQQVSDWLAPELTNAQLEYAAGDVAHLIGLADELEAKCAAAGLTSELKESFAYLPTRVKLDIRGSGDVFSY